MDLVQNLDEINRSITVKVIIFQCIQAVKEMHELGWSHRDLKLQNILVSEEGKVQLIDFGTSKPLSSFEASLLKGSRCAMNLAELVSENSTTAQVDSRQSFVGTDYYLPPEVKSGKPQYGVLMDVYSLGMVCYELLTSGNKAIYDAD